MDDMYNRIKRLCFENNTNITQMCRDTGIGRNTIMSLNQTGRVIGMKPATLKKIADHFGITVEELTGESAVQTEPKPAMPAQSKEFSDAAVELIDILQELKDRPELKILFKSAQGASSEQILATSKLLSSMKGEEND